MNIELANLGFVPCGLAVFWFCRPAVAVFIVFLGGWLLLPVGHFPAGSASADFPYWITGLAVPSDMLLTKAWIAPAVALLGTLAFDRAAWSRLRPLWMDAPMALWCAWPLLQSLVAAEPRPQPALASLYLLGSWGLPWLIGRMYGSTREGQQLLATGLAWSALACLPFSLIEGAIGPAVYGWVYEPHPFRFDGAIRYLGYRPLGFFEDGNQFGLWVSMSALAAFWLAVTAPAGAAARGARATAALVGAMAVAAQSVGALLMLGIGAGFLWACRLLRPRRMVAAVAVVLIVGGAVYVSGVVPITEFGKNTALGQKVVDVFRAAGRGSFTWRISQDQKLLPDAMARPVAGSAAWDWWRPKGTRPWGLSVLVLGQFGLVGLGLCFGALLAAPLRLAWRAPRASGWRAQGLPLMLATLVVLTALDALMNSFIFFPAIVVAGGLAAESARRPRGEITRLGVHSVA
jgi:hypothetical protein